ncbi:hypothetical protein JTY93_18905 [Pseudomonas hygromyciniae]|uniref:Uncharacterized protein n=1 Tax=Pseudomonas hygromyciniae TaxID=2812000 RepID=A0ABX7JT84_9PSED|nr:hypothetical protein [Pseudomonas hygromyciniae]MBN0978075.1 hypothetical protein [Pseudomonas hygromyciniae]QSB38325.1 hypothetical protein JTY93_18905 [Pseudomonas hygromyciniae]
MQITQQLAFDFDTAQDAHHNQPVRLLATMPFPPTPESEPEKFYGIFLPRRMLDKNDHHRR